MSNKSNARKNSPPASDGDSPEKEAPFAYLTSREYRRLREREPDEAQIYEYIHLQEKMSQRDVLEQEFKNAAPSETAEYMRVMESSTRIHQNLIWEARRKLVEGMNLASLESLAKHYDISPGSECIRDHPNANDLDKGLLLARMRQFLWWDGEYHGTAPEMYSIDVEAAKNAATSRAGKPLPPDNAPFESMLRYASACKKASDGMLLRALQDCIAVTIACPALEKKLTLRIKTIGEEIEELRDTDEYENTDDARKSLKTLKGKLRDSEGTLAEIRAYATDFAPGILMPPIVENATDNWMTPQFAAGSPVGSIVRLAWLLNVFQSFWENHQSSYLASDPTQREAQKKAVAHGKLGAAKKADDKWRRFTTRFLEYLTASDGSSKCFSNNELCLLVQDFGGFLLAEKVPGASDKRTVGVIIDFLVTLVTNLDQTPQAGAADSVYRILIGSSTRRGNGRYRRGPFSTLTADTVAGCLQILRDGLKGKKATPSKERTDRS